MYNLIGPALSWRAWNDGFVGANRDRVTDELANAGRAFRSQFADALDEASGAPPFTVTPEMNNALYLPLFDLIAPTDAEAATFDWVKVWRATDDVPLAILLNTHVCFAPPSLPIAKEADLLEALPHNFEAKRLLTALFPSLGPPTINSFGIKNSINSTILRDAISQFYEKATAQTHACSGHPVIPYIKARTFEAAQSKVLSVRHYIFCKTPAFIAKLYDDRNLRRQRRRPRGTARPPRPPPRRPSPRRRPVVLRRAPRSPGARALRQRRAGRPQDPTRLNDAARGALIAILERKVPPLSTSALPTSTRSSATHGTSRGSRRRSARSPRTESCSSSS